MSRPVIPWCSSVPTVVADEASASFVRLPTLICSLRVTRMRLIWVLTSWSVSLRSPGTLRRSPRVTLWGNFHVISTRDCSVQRRNQKLVEEAPAPFLPEGAHEMLVNASRALSSTWDYVGVGHGGVPFGAGR